MKPLAVRDTPCDQALDIDERRPRDVGILIRQAGSTLARKGDKRVGRRGHTAKTDEPGV